MNDYKQAIPTEFREVVYRSKSEAVLERSFECVKEIHNDKANLIAYYEPKQLKLKDKYIPDFLLIETRSGDGWPPVLTAYVIEYKPSIPTKTYLDKLIKRFQECYTVLYKAVPFEVTCLLVVGSYLNQQSRCIYYFTGSGFTKSHYHGWEYLGITDSIVNKASNFRFDLEQ